MHRTLALLFAALVLAACTSDPAAPPAPAAPDCSRCPPAGGAGGGAGGCEPGGEGGGGAAGEGGVGGGAGAGGAGGAAGGAGSCGTAGAGGAAGAGGCPAPERTLKVMTFNIRHGAESSLEDVAQAINDEAPDIVALQEVDNEAVRSGGVQQHYRLGQLTGKASMFRTALTFTDGGQYGLAVLSRFPVLSSEKVSLTSGAEQRVLVIADLELEPGLHLPFAVTHLGLTSDERLTQAQEISDALAGRPWAMLLGDLNEESGGGAVQRLLELLVDVWPLAGTGPGGTHPADAPDRRIDFILLSREWGSPRDAHVPVTTASDHRPLVVTVPWPGSG